MNPIALILVILSASIHSFWNLFSKKSRNKLVFNWYIVFFSLIIYFPVFLYFIFTKKIPPIGWLFISLSGIFIAGYFYFLGKSYSYGDFSLTYPISRSSIIFVPILAAIIIKEKISFIGILGIGIILIGIFMLHLKSFKITSLFEVIKSVKNKVTVFALLTALVLAFGYMNDKIAVQFVFPFLLIYLAFVISSILHIPTIFSKNNRKDIKKEWKNNKKSILVSAFLVQFSYVLILFAFMIEKVSYITALRQLSIVFGVILGSLILKEKYGKIRLIASMIMLAGFFLVAIA